MKSKGEAGEWVKLLVEVIYGVILSALYILKEGFELIIPMSGKSLTGQHVLVTGAARGLGRELCLELAKEGCKITCVDVHLEGCQETLDLVKQRGGSGQAVKCDITLQEEVVKLFRGLPAVDVLINNAGIVSSASILEVEQEHIERMFQVNVMSHFWTIREALPSMIQRGRGHIVGIASAAAFTAAANIAPYTATKYAVTGMMASLREEMRKKYPEINITSVHPFFISPPPSCVEHWEKTSRLPDVTAEEVAQKTVAGIKRNKATITVPAHLYHLLYMLMGIPTEAGDLWRDMFYANISSLEAKKPSSETNGKIQNGNGIKMANKPSYLSL